MTIARYVIAAAAALALPAGAEPLADKARELPVLEVDGASTLVADHLRQLSPGQRVVGCSHVPQQKADLMRPQ